MSYRPKNSNMDSILLPDSFTVGEHDVLCGRGSVCYNHIGNQRFRSMVQSYLGQYSGALTKFQKSFIICEIIDNVRRNSPCGGFVKQDLLTRRYYAIGDHHAREKVSHAFRDLLQTKKCKFQVKNIQQLNFNHIERCIESAAQPSTVNFSRENQLKPNLFDLNQSSSKEYRNSNAIEFRNVQEFCSVNEAVPSKVDNIFSSSFKNNPQVDELDINKESVPPYYSEGSALVKPSLIPRVIKNDISDSNKSLPISVFNEDKNGLDWVSSAKENLIGNLYDPIPIGGENSLINEFPSYLSFHSIQSISIKPTANAVFQTDTTCKETVIVTVNNKDSIHEAYEHFPCIEYKTRSIEDENTHIEWPCQTKQKTILFDNNIHLELEVCAFENKATNLFQFQQTTYSTQQETYFKSKSRISPNFARIFYAKSA